MPVVKLRPARARRRTSAQRFPARSGRRRPGASSLRRYPGLVLIIAAIVAIGAVEGREWLTADAPSIMIGAPSHITDGDTLRMGAVRIRLQGIDAPEMDTPEGPLARRHLIALVGAGPVSCRDTGQRSYDRIVAVCRTSDGRDIAKAMVEDGWAADWPRYSGGRYALAQARARLERRGMYGG